MEYFKILVIENDETVKFKLNQFFSTHLPDKAFFMNLTSPGSDILTSNIFDLVVVDWNHFDLSISELIEKLKKIVEATSLSDTIPIIVAKKSLDDDVPLKSQLERVCLIDDVLDFQLFQKLIKQLLAPSIHLPYLCGIADAARPEPELLIESIVTTFMESVPEKIKKIEMLFHARDFDGVAKLAHALRSTSYSVGAHDFANLLSKLEEKARCESEKINGRQWGKKLEHAFVRASTSLAKIRDNKLYLNC